MPWVSALAVDGAYIYLGNEATGVVERRALADMDAVHVLATGQKNLDALAAADGLVIWSRSSPVGPPTGAIMAVGAFGGEPWVIRDKLYASGVAYHGGWLYFTEFGNGVFRTQLEDGLDKKNTEVIESDTINTRGVTVHGQTVFWAAMNATNRISSRELGPGHSTVVLAENQVWPQSIHADATRVYWVGRQYGKPVGELRARSDAHPTPRAIVSDRPIVATSLAGNATSVFWAEEDGHVYRLAK